jgi:hypothetical protein
MSKMAERPRKVLICSCDDTMPLDGAGIRRACKGAEVLEGRQLCRAELERFRKAAADGAAVTVACTQEAPLFAEVAGETDGAGTLAFVNIRETAGWSKDAKDAGPKMAALIAAAAEPMPDYPYVSLSSEGAALLYGKDERVLEAAALLKDHLDLTVLIKDAGAVLPLRVTEFPLLKGAIKSAKGALGSFELTIDGYAQPAPSSRALHHLHRRPLRACSLRHRRLPALPRSLPDRRHCARRQPRAHRRFRLRRLRPMRRRLPDRRRRLRAAAVRRAVAQVAGAACDLRASRRRATGRAVP